MGRPTPKLCDCGCGLPAPLAPRTEKRKGWEKGQPIRFIKNHSLGAPRLEWGQHLWSVEDQGFTTPCWIWIFAKDVNGYGIFANRTRVGKSRLAHRESYLRATGEIPEHLPLDHLCRVPSCVRPDHLEPVTPGENVRRSARTRMTPDVLTKIFELRQVGLTQREIAEEVGFSRTTVEYVLAGKRWA